MAKTGRELIHKPESEGLGDLGVDRIWTIPNAITFVRLLCIPLFVWLLFSRESRGWAAFTLGALGSTDWVDGYLARRLNQGSNFGKMFDPTVDRLMMVVAIVSIMVDGSAPAWFCWIILIREIVVSTYVVAITALGAARMDVTWWGKCGTFANMGAFPSFMFGAEQSFSHGVRTAWTVVAYVAAVPGLVCSLVAAFQYFAKGPEAVRVGREERAQIDAEH